MSNRYKEIVSLLAHRHQPYAQYRWEEIKILNHIMDKNGNVWFIYWKKNGTYIQGYWFIQRKDVSEIKGLNLLNKFDYRFNAWDKVGILKAYTTIRRWNRFWMNKDLIEMVNKAWPYEVRDDSWEQVCLYTEDKQDYFYFPHLVIYPRFTNESI